MATVYLALGSNQGNRRKQLIEALRQINQLPKTKVVKTSSWIETDPIGPGPQGQYLNGAARITTSLPPKTLLIKLQQIERKLGRPKNHKRMSARTIDLDIIDYQGVTIKTKELTLPHPEAHKRPFVMQLLREITPQPIS
jgi:2-amino-4-hydroxy-6-hydroxymethyldihydropteridine diphosphokinase